MLLVNGMTIGVLGTGIKILINKWLMLYYFFSL